MNRTTVENCGKISVFDPTELDYGGHSGFKLWYSEHFGVDWGGLLFENCCDTLILCFVCLFCVCLCVCVCVCHQRSSKSMFFVAVVFIWYVFKGASTSLDATVSAFSSVWKL